MAVNQNHENKHQKRIPFARADRRPQLCPGWAGVLYGTASGRGYLKEGAVFKINTDGMG